MAQPLEATLTPLCRNLRAALDLPGLAVGVVQDGRVAYARGFGLRDVATRKPLSERSLFHMASVSKLFVTTAVVQLWERGRLDLAEPVTRYLPYFALADERYTAITVEQMLSHTSGMPDVEDYDWAQPEYDEGAAERYVRSLRDQKMIADPGVKFAYSNMAFEVLGDLVAKVSGEPFEEYVQSNVLGPAGMRHSTFLKERVSPRLATSPHLRTPRLDVSDIYPYHRAHAPSSTLHSSALEMCAWGQVHLNRGTLQGRQILAPATYDLLWRPRAPVDWGEGPETEKIGLGWFLWEHRGLRAVSHGGGDVGFNTYFVMLPEKGAAVTVLTNVLPGMPRTIALAVLDVVLGYEPELPKPPLLTPLGRVLADKGLDAAVAHYRRSGEKLRESHDPDPNYLLAVASMLIEVKHFPAAVDLLRLGQEVYPEEWRTFRMLGEAYAKSGDRERAVENLQEALRRKPDSTAAAELLAELTEESATFADSE
jgi:CubicO group peptidase (beta-lactamase class C family)